MSKVLSRDGYVEMVRDCYAGMDWARDELENHDAAQRARIAELETDLAIERQRVMVGIAQMEMATKRIKEMSDKLAEMRRAGGDNRV